MSVHYGDIPLGQVIYHLFDTFAGTTGASITMTGLAVTDIEVYKNGSATQRSSDAGYTLLDTDGIDFDGLTGIHGFSINTGDNTDAGFFSVGGWYNVVVSAITVDSQTVSFVAFSFRLVSAEGVAGTPNANATHLNSTTLTGRDIGASVLLSSGTGTGQVTLTSGRVNADLTHVATAAVSTSSAQIGVNVVNFGGAAGTFASGIPAVNATQISGDSTAADNLETAFDDTAGPVPWLGILDQGTAQSATSTTIVLRAAAAFANDTIIGCVVGALGSTQGYWQFREITDYVLSTDTATVDTWAVTPSGTITYKVFAGVPAPVTPPAVNVTQVIGDPIIASSSKTTNWGGTP
jgi:hypothetical protein